MKKVLGIELGSTRIKAVLIDEGASVIAQGSYDWENKLEGGYWTYSLDEVWKGLQGAYSTLCENYGEKIEELDGIGISAMMHGYLAFDKNDNLLVPFRTWRNTTTAKAASELTEALSFNMPQRWSASHFYQAVLNKEEHIKDVAFLTTLAGYVHWMLTGKKVLGIGDAAGMFPVKDNDYDKDMLKIYNSLLSKNGVNTHLEALLPTALVAGEDAGYLTEKGAEMLDPTHTLKAGAPLCPPEGDAGTGMVATNAIKPRTGNVSAGTSAFTMVVLEKPLTKVNTSIDIVATPTGEGVAMVHANNFTNEINAWAGIFEEIITLTGGSIKKGALLDKMYEISAQSDENVGGLTAYNFLSGEPIVGFESGAPLVLRTANSNFNLANFTQMLLYSAISAMSIGMEALSEENVKIDDICGHGGFFKYPFIGANAMSAGLGAPITVMKNAGEGGAWGVAVLALYNAVKQGSLGDFLDKIFASAEKETTIADEKTKAKFANFMKSYKANLDVEKLASNINN